MTTQCIQKHKWQEESETKRITCISECLAVFSDFDRLFSAPTLTVLLECAVGTHQGVLLDFSNNKISLLCA